MCNSLARQCESLFLHVSQTFLMIKRITISCSLEVFFLGRLHYKNEIAVAERSRWHLHIPFLVTGFPPEGALVHSLSRILSLSFSLSPLLSPRIFSPLRPRDIDSQVFEWEGIIKRRTSNGGIRRNLIFRTKSIDSPIGRALTTLFDRKGARAGTRGRRAEKLELLRHSKTPETKRLG